MSNHPQKWPIDQALAVATELQTLLTPACARIAIVGSIRRGKPLVGDVEILYISHQTDRRDGLFDTVKVAVADEVLDQLVQRGLLARRPNVNGHISWGNSNKFAVHVPSGIPVDLFATTEPNWFVALVIRTGSRDTNLRLTHSAIDLGRHLYAYGPGVKMPDGHLEPATSEQDVFRLCGLPYLPPSKR